MNCFFFQFNDTVTVIALPGKDIHSGAGESIHDGNVDGDKGNEKMKNYGTQAAVKKLDKPTNRKATKSKQDKENKAMQRKENPDKDDVVTRCSLSSNQIGHFFYFQWFCGELVIAKKSDGSLILRTC